MPNKPNLTNAQAETWNFNGFDEFDLEEWLTGVPSKEECFALTERSQP